MCGLVGVAGRMTTDFRKVFKRLLELDTIRGPHSTGVLFVRTGMNKTEPQVEVLKKLGTPWDLFQLKNWDTNWQTKENRVLMGHNRWATKGAINGINAHPFEFNKLVGAHNGTLRKQELLDDHKQFEVDSENLYHHMNKHGLDDTLMKTCGAFALTWWDKEKHTINFIRNHERPLFYTYDEDNQAIFWASEKWMLQIALSGQGVKYKKIQEFNEHTHYSLHIPEASNYVERKLEKLVYSKKEVYTPPVFPQSGGVGNASGSTVANNPGRKPTPLAVLMNKPQEFRITTSSAMGNKVTFFGYLVDDYGVKVRVFVDRGDDNYEVMRSFGVNGTFVGKVSGFRQGTHSIDHVIIDPDSVSKKPLTTGAGHAGGSGGSKLFGFEGAPLTRNEWFNRTVKGCCWCGDPAVEKEAADLKWLSKDEFLCGTCRTDTEATRYLIKNEG